ncbi:putative peptidase y4nA [Symbiodinium microadriaticum]|uniref:Prolyl endopeptidase n=1 Tax=Symbiodinium microadriaticum TaxID=2951 RepID=A0A1Q9DTL7_SYMMI|nr:putative peptidase y4nA [Symbiodinium microadriaticum]
MLRKAALAAAATRFASTQISRRKLGSSHRAKITNAITNISPWAKQMSRPHVKSARMAATAASDDPFVWLEEVNGEKCLEWAKEKNEVTFAKFGRPDSAPLYGKILEILESKDKIAYVQKIDDFYYNFWQDADHIRGIWRRCTLEEYKKPAKEIQWELVLDLDALGKEEGESWVWHSPTFIDEGPGQKRDLCLLALSPGGTDAEVVREFSLETKAFIPESENGFKVGACKTRVSYKSRDVLLIGTDTGAEDDMTDSGYPRQVREWQRGFPLKDAPLVYEAEKKDISSFASRYYDRGFFHEMRGRAITFWTSEYFWLHQGEWKKVDVPDDMRVSTFCDRFQLTLRSDWTVGGQTYVQGSLLSIPIDSLFAGDMSKLEVLFAPSESESLEDTTGTRNYLILSVLEDVKTKLIFWRYKDGAWERLERNVKELDNSGDDLWVTVSGYTRPTSLFLTTAEELCSGKLPSMTPLKALPSYYKADDIEVQQFFATSLDGTKVPYFQLSKKDIAYDGKNPTLLYGYGGFEISLTPAYSGARGIAWLEHGGVWIDANIRGGGEYGPRWHQAAKKANRNKAYEDFEAVAEDLLRRGVTTRALLGIQGGSNGGLLMGNMLTREKRELFGAIVCQVPLLDMQRYSQLLAGASWMGEYGDPATSDWEEFLKQYSPYHNLSDDKTYLPALFVTSTKDDRVHPGHARKMVAKLLAHPTAKDHTFYYENIEGGHGGAADNKQRAFMQVAQYAFLWKTLSPGRQPETIP